MKLYSIRLLVTDFAACFRFYRDTLGIELVWGEESGPYADFITGSDGYISIFSRRLMAETLGTENLPQKAPSQDYFSVIIQVDDLVEVVDDLKLKGVSFVSEPKDYPAWTISAAHLRDPEGNLIELFTPLSRDKWTDEARDRDQRTSRE